MTTGAGGGAGGFGGGGAGGVLQPTSQAAKKVQPRPR